MPVSVLASGATSASIGILFNKVTNLAFDEIKKVVRSDDNLDKLECTFSRTRNLLQKFEIIYGMNINIANRQFLQRRVNKLNRLSNKAVDLMGDLEYIKCPYSGLSDKPVLKAILRSPQNWNKPWMIVNLQKQMDRILWELKVILENVKQPQSLEVTPHNHYNHPGKFIVERTKDVEEIVRVLLSGSSCDSAGVSLVGMDGLGKTTLAQAIKNEARVQAHLSVIEWFDIPDGYFNLDEIISKWNQHGETDDRSSDRDYNALIIFDNLLKVTLFDWSGMYDHIMKTKINGKECKNIQFLITTCTTKVVLNTRTSTHYLKPLREEDSFKVIDAAARSINQSLFRSHDHTEIIQTLAKHAVGFPPVAHCLGTLLGQHGVDRMNGYLEDLWNSDVFRTEILPHLWPCYSNIQLSLKPHFAYFSLFPSNYLFTADNLVHLWCAEEFVEELDTSKLIKEGEKHFNELCGLSVLLQLDDKARNGTPIYKLNQFSHNFAQLAASKTCLMIGQDVLSPDIDTLHLSLRYNNKCFPKWEKIQQFKHLRTIFGVLESNIGKIPYSALKKLFCLRVLSLSGSDVRKLPDSIKCLKNLHYLDISHTPITSLPDTLCDLGALQFLKLTKNEGGLTCLPKGFEKLTSLIHIDWDVKDVSHMGRLPAHIGKLSKLQTLPLFPVGTEAGHLISELKNMNHLQGSIRITNLENVDLATSRDAELHTKAFRRVELEWKRPRRTRIDGGVLTCLRPHRNLKELKIINYQGHAFPDWMTRSLSYLEKMHLQKCRNVQGFAGNNGALNSLKMLVLEEIGSPVYVDQPFFGQLKFPELESLKLKHMDKLQTLNLGLEADVMPRIKALKFTDCPELIDLSSLQHLSSLEKLKIQRCGKMISLPDLPISLKSLTVIECDLLAASCRRKGDDWAKMDRIKTLVIDHETIPTSASEGNTTPLDRSGGFFMRQGSRFWRHFTRKTEKKPSLSFPTHFFSTPIP